MLADYLSSDDDPYGFGKTNPYATALGSTSRTPALASLAAPSSGVSYSTAPATTAAAIPALSTLLRPTSIGTVTTNMAPDIQGNDGTVANDPRDSANAAVAVADPFDDQIRALYAKYGRSTPTQAEIDSHRGNPDGLAGVEEMLKRGAGPDDSHSGTPAPTAYNASTVLPVLQKYPHTPAGLAQAVAENPAFFAGAKITGSKGDKLQLPDGRVIDVIVSAGTGGDAWYWGEGSSTGNAAGSLNIDQSLLEPWGKTYVEPEIPLPTLPEYTAPEVPAIPEWKAPTGAELASDPGAAYRQQQAQKAFENSRSASRTVRSGGYLSDLLSLNSNLASQEYGNLYQRQRENYDKGIQNAFTQWQEKQDAASSSYAPKLTEYQAQVNAATQEKSASWAQYLQAYTEWQQHQAFLAETLFKQANLGLSAASAG